MTIAINRLPDRQLAELSASYARAAKANQLRILIGLVVLAICIALASWVAEINLFVLFGRIGGFGSYIVRIFHLEDGSFVLANPVEWFWGLRKWSYQLAETILISYVGTIMGAFFGFILCFLASENLSPSTTTRFVTRRFLEFSRTVPDIVFALIFVVAFGLGPMPGVMAISLHTMGALGKQFTEIVENIDMKPVDGLKATGANYVKMLRFAVVPQVLAGFSTYALLRFEINVRGASVMGFVGAGGIGQDLLEAIRKFYYSDVSAILVMIILTVFVIDMLTEKLRHSLISGQEKRS